MKGLSWTIFIFCSAALLGFNDLEKTARRNMVDSQIAARGITDARILSAFLKVKRHLFVEPQYQTEAYNDYPLPIGSGQTISQPYIVAMMTNCIPHDKLARVLEIGTGSGYQSAILSQLVQDVYTIEIIPQLATQAKKILDQLGYVNIHCKTGDGYRGWPEFAPYDGIIVTCAPDHIPTPLIDQLKTHGFMVIPVGAQDSSQNLILVEKMPSGHLKKTILIPVRFVPLIHSKADKGHD